MVVSWLNGLRTKFQSSINSQMSRRRLRQMARSSRFVELLESRLLLTTTLYLDFGAGIGMGNQLNTTVNNFATIFGNGIGGNGTGSNLIGEGPGGNTLIGADSLDF